MIDTPITAQSVPEVIVTWADLSWEEASINIIERDAGLLHAAIHETLPTTLT